MQQYIVSLDFSHLVFMFRPHAGSSFKQDDVWRMQLNGSYRNRGLNLRFLFITGTMENKSLFLVLPLLLGGGHTVCRTCVCVCVCVCFVWPNVVIAKLKIGTRAGVFWIRTENLVFPEQYADVQTSLFFFFAESHLGSMWGMLRGAWNGFIKLEGKRCVWFITIPHLMRGALSTEAFLLYHLLFRCRNVGGICIAPN